MEKIPFNEANQIKGGGVPIVMAECIAFTGDLSGLELISKIGLELISKNDSSQENTIIYSSFSEHIGNI